MTFDHKATIRVIDLETTGFPPDAEVIEIAAIDVTWRPFALPDVDDWVEFKSFVKPVGTIPPTASAIHHLIDEDVAGALPWAQVWPNFINWSPQIFCAHSAKFERAFITDEMTEGKPWICTWKCALRLWPDAQAHSNQALRYLLKPPGIKRERAALAHRAWPDTYVTAHLLALMLEQTTVDQLVAWSAEPAVLARVPFGAPPPQGSRGLPWSKIDDGLLDWVLRRDFDEDVMFTAKIEAKRRADAQRERNLAFEEAGDGGGSTEDDEVDA